MPVSPHVEMAVRSCMGGLTEGTADQWCYCLSSALNIASACPAPESFGFTGDRRFSPVTWDDFVSHFGLTAAGKKLLFADGTAGKPATDTKGRRQEGSPTLKLLNQLSDSPLVVIAITAVILILILKSRK